MKTLEGVRKKAKVLLDVIYVLTLLNQYVEQTEEITRTLVYVLAEVTAKNIVMENAHKKKVVRDVLEFSNLFVVKRELLLIICAT